MPKFVQLHMAGVVSQVLTVVVADVWSGWFRQALVDGWAFCMVVPPAGDDGVGTLVAHLGGRRGAFGAAADAIGRGCVRHV